MYTQVQSCSVCTNLGGGALAGDGEPDDVLPFDAAGHRVHPPARVQLL